MRDAAQELVSLWLVLNNCFQLYHLSWLGFIALSLLFLFTLKYYED